MADLIGKITREHIEDHYLEVLNKYFKVTPLERYPDAMIKLYLKDVSDSVLGISFNKKKIGRKKVKKIYDNVLKKMRVHYGKYVNLTNFQLKNDRSVRFSTNFHLIFKVKNENQNLGFLYGLDVNCLGKNLLFTSHSLERIEERLPKEIIEAHKKRIKSSFNCEGTILDIASGILMALSVFQYGIYEDYYYFNLEFGVLVL